MKKMKVTYWSKINGFSECDFTHLKLWFDSPADCIEFIRKNIGDNEYNDMYFNFIKLEVLP